MTSAILNLSSSSAAMSHALEQRKHHRVATNHPALMRRIDPYAPGYLRVTILDHSHDGLRLACEVRLEPEMTVHVRSEHWAALGEVRHCSAVPDGFQAGLKLGLIAEF